MKVNRQKYRIVKMLVNKLSGCGYEKTRSNLKKKLDFLGSQFPGCFQLTWGRILDSKNLINLGENISTPRLRRSLIKLVEKFTGGKPSSILIPSKMMKLDLDHGALKRLKQLCNAVETDIENSTEQTSRDVIHVYHVT